MFAGLAFPNAFIGRASGLRTRERAIKREIPESMVVSGTWGERTNKKSQPVHSNFRAYEKNQILKKVIINYRKVIPILMWKRICV